ncbi:alkane 1-monooxygenase [Flavobacterium sp.]|uniref:alkane 1-monooxygenase n=1 Tax=Flavobacterium sp. TaxID=239 RepID=UPI0024886530|nr:alkane 1-monooxygenase [Flavobacterium sp.]MDI1316878.1 alkane 1-monooxygenase [Flavobacterium sp.]
MKYLLAYCVPLISFFGIYLGGFWSYAGIIFVFGILPFLELIFPKDEKNYSEAEIKNKLKNRLFDVLLYLNVFIVYGMLFFALHKVATVPLSLVKMIGVILSLGVVLGSNGINVAHELGHRDKLYERVLGKLLLIPSHYTHFFIEHNHGHHLHVSTPEDPSSARYNQSVYAFWIQTIFGTYIKAWQIQTKLNKMENRSFLSLKNDMFWFTIIQISYLIATYYFFGRIGFLVALLAGIVGLLLLETINYIEHYGLRRNRLPSGRYERVSEKHSWNSNHVLGRIMLYELTRHSDHHYKSQKKYQILEYHDVSPQMPFGYPTSMVLSFFPPLWFAVMNKRIPLEMKT